MSTEEFKKLVSDCLKQNGLSKKGNYFYKNAEGVLCIVGLQRSSYSEAYYLNIGYLINELHPDLKNPKDYQAEFRARFNIKLDGHKPEGLIELDKLSKNNLNELIAQLKKNINIYISPINSLEDLMA